MTGVKYEIEMAVSVSGTAINLICQRETVHQLHRDTIFTGGGSAAKYSTSVYFPSAVSSQVIFNVFPECTLTAQRTEESKIDNDSTVRERQ